MKWMRYISPYTGIGSVALGTTPPPLRPLFRRKQILRTFVRTKYSSFKDGALVAGTGNWSTLGAELFDLAVMAASSHDASHVYTSTLEIELAGGNMPVQVTFEDVETNLTGPLSPVYTLRDPFVLQAGTGSVTLNYNDPGLGKAKGGNRCMICVPAEGG